MNGLTDILKAIEPLGLPAEKVYLRGDVLLLNADSLEALPLLNARSFDAVVTDPNYGIGEAAGKNKSRTNLAVAKDYGNDDWDNEPCSPAAIADMRRVSRWQIIFGGNYFELPPTSCYLVWDKLNTGDFADCELAWTNLDKAVRRLAFRWNGFVRDEECDRVHPTQKPVGVMTWAMSHLPNGDTILDPFAGSSTTLVACIRTGRKCVGIEREKKYFDASVDRLDKEFKRLELLEPVPPRISQQRLFVEKVD